MKKYRKLGNIFSDILVILILLKFGIQYLMKFSGWSNVLVFSLLIGGILAIAIRLNMFKTLLSGLAVFIFFGDLFVNATSEMRFSLGALVITAIILYFALILVGPGES